MQVENRLKSALKLIETGETVVLLARWWVLSEVPAASISAHPVGIGHGRKPHSGRKKRRFGVLGALDLRQRDITENHRPVSGSVKYYKIIGLSPVAWFDRQSDKDKFCGYGRK